MKNKLANIKYELEDFLNNGQTNFNEDIIKVAQLLLELIDIVEEMNEEEN